VRLSSRTALPSPPRARAGFRDPGAYFIVRRRPHGVHVTGIVTFLLAVAALWGCSDSPATPEAEIRALIADMETGAESGDIDPFKAALADSFQGEGGLDRARTLNRVRLFLLRRQSIHALVRIEGVEVTGAGQARATVLVATASRPLDSPESLAAYRANIHRVLLYLDKDDGEWRVYRAEWERASAGDLIRLW